MPAKVIDASALAAVLFGEPDAEEVVARVEGFDLVAPTLLSFEIASVCLKKIRRHPARRAGLLASLATMARMGIDEVAIDLREALLLAERARLTVYDAAYLWLARSMGVELVTLDRRLAMAARA